MSQRPRIILIAAMSENRVIGVGNRLPWRLPDDFAFFRRTTMDNFVVMGRRTWESLKGEPLQGRSNIVLTGEAATLSQQASGSGDTPVHFVSSIEQALKTAGSAPLIYIIGGGEVYAAFMDHADEILLTIVEAHVEGDVHFPPLPECFQYITRLSRHDADERHAFPFRVERWVKQPASRRSKAAGAACEITTTDAANVRRPSATNSSTPSE
ncbi:MAG: dihydrofolate reductase [Phycisphaerales bacterium]